MTLRPANAITIRVLPVNSSAPLTTTRIRPRLNTSPPSSLEIPGASVASDVTTCEKFAPSAMNAPASTPSGTSLRRGSAAFITPTCSALAAMSAGRSASNVGAGVSLLMAPACADDSASDQGLLSTCGMDWRGLDPRVNTWGMDLNYAPADEDFRAEIRDWLETKLPAGWFEPGFELSAQDRRTFNEGWPAKLFEGGWICATWPKEYGGKGLTTMQGVVLSEEFARAKAPLRADFFGDTLVGPTILQWGTEEQKKDVLPKILNGTMSWCQGFSEPNSGSDLASLTTSAVLDGDEWLINGQKVWTTQGHHADYCFLLTRTDPDAPKHKGISYLLVPMRQPGVEVRGITQPDGTAEFCEVFFTDARCPKDNVVGGVNNGWKVANSTLAFERGMSATTGYRRFEEELKLMVAAAKDNGAIDDPTIRQALVRYYSKIQILRVNGLRSLSATLSGARDAGVAALGATNKMYWSEMHQEAMQLALSIRGAESMLIDTGAAAGSWPGTGRDKGRPGYPVSPMMSAFFFSRSETIWGGTSQIQRNIVGERVLGLPKEPQAAT